MKCSLGPKDFAQRGLLEVLPPGSKAQTYSASLAKSVCNWLVCSACRNVCPVKACSSFLAEMQGRFADCAYATSNPDIGWQAQLSQEASIVLDPPMYLSWWPYGLS